MNFLRFPDLKEKKGIPYTTVHLRRLEEAGKFPRRVRLGDGKNGAVAWLEDEIDEWGAERAAARDAEPQEGPRASTASDASPSNPSRVTARATQRAPPI